MYPISTSRSTFKNLKILNIFIYPLIIFRNCPEINQSLINISCFIASILLILSILVDKIQCYIGDIG